MPRNLDLPHHPSCPRRGWAPDEVLDLACTCPTMPESIEYEWRCFGTIVCEPLGDVHGRECDRLNDEAREEFYADLAAEDVAHVIMWHVRQARVSA